ncbi:cell wall-associated NlpC family hydrolase [Actinomadura luteofluorescens]|uniref:Cell wall-associated NlpC family hydrolase n=1 Tax=Actinomadura luteofluorescens TaxID=46163 RepID=A0A7Y9JI45_9ACTN|nr:hydrolase [Actinomadura luteofluorescens]NYD49615.1 cell wall-associated NlpC family hydrolase [Actinomadura luteofluorescens]
MTPAAVLENLPDGLWATRYVGARFPGSPQVAATPGLAEGANCQLFAYEVLRWFGFDPPDLRSSELWADAEFTERVDAARPYDLVLFNATQNPWGAHVGICAGEDQILHLCAEVGHPAVWTWQDFKTRPRYQTLIGAKRVLRRLPAPGA